MLLGICVNGVNHPTYYISIYIYIHTMAALVQVDSRAALACTSVAYGNRLGSTRGGPCSEENS